MSTNKIIQFIKRYFRFAFFGKIRKAKRSNPELVYPLEEVNIENQSEKQPPFKEASKEQVRNRLIVRINWLLMFVCILSFAFIIIHPFVQHDKPVPDIIQNAFFTTLGWFGGVLGAFFQVEQNDNSSQ